VVGTPAERGIEPVTQRLQRLLPLLPDHIDFGIVGDRLDLGHFEPVIHRFPSGAWVRRFHARSFRRAIDDDPVGVGCGGEGVDDGTVALEILGTHRKYVGVALRPVRPKAVLPMQLFGQCAAVDDHQEIDVTVTCGLVARATRTGSRAAA
jgi:hypothetical protein